MSRSSIADAGSTDGTLEFAEHYGVDQVVDNPLQTGESGKGRSVRGPHAARYSRSSTPTTSSSGRTGCGV